MTALLRLVDKIEHFHTLLGRKIAYLIPVMAIVVFVIVIFRYVFSLGWVWAQDVVLYLHGLSFMFGIVYTLQKDAHVRIDIFYNTMSPKKQALVNLCGILGLAFPPCVLILTYALPYVMNSWVILEASLETGGMPGVFLIKTAVLLLPVLLILQLFCIGVRCFFVLFGKGIFGRSKLDGF